MEMVSTLATNQGRSMAVAMGAAFYDDPKRVLSDIESYREVTRKDIKRVAEKYINENWVFYQVGPEK